MSAKYLKSTKYKISTNINNFSRNGTCNNCRNYHFSNIVKKQRVHFCTIFPRVSHLLTEEYCNLFNFLRIGIDQVELLITKKGIYVSRQKTDVQVLINESYESRLRLQKFR